MCKTRRKEVISIGKGSKGEKRGTQKKSFLSPDPVPGKKKKGEVRCFYCQIVRREIRGK